MSEAERERIYQTAITQLKADHKPKLKSPAEIMRIAAVLVASLRS